MTEQQTRITALRGKIRELKSDSELWEIRDHLSKRAGKIDWSGSAMFGLLSVRSQQRAKEMSGILSDFYVDDQKSGEGV